jgi:hypothetical protein
LKFIVSIVFFLGTFQILAQRPFYYVSNQDTVLLDTMTFRNVGVFGKPHTSFNLGNEGTPMHPLVMDQDFFMRGAYTYLAFQSLKENRRYSVFKPVTEASYITGSKLEQHFNIYHTQNFNPKSNFSIGFNKINSPGYYNNQATNNSHLSANAYGSGIGKRNYTFDFNIQYANLLSALNGGMVYDTAFIDDVNELRDRKLLEINLQNASQQLKYWKIDLTHSLDVFSKKDTTNERGQTLSVFQNMAVMSKQRDFYDSILNPIFYNQIFNDSNITNDVLTYYQYSTDLGVNYTLSQKYKASLASGIKPSLNIFNQASVDTTVFDLHGFLNFWYQYEKWNVALQSEYLINDAYVDNDFHLNANFSYLMNSKNKFSAQIQMKRERVALDIQNYESNNAKWSNTFEKQSQNFFEIQYEHQDKLKKYVSVNYLDLKNPIFFSYDARPDQVLGYGQVIQSKAGMSGDLSKRWYLQGDVVYQYFGGYNVFRMPNWFTQAKIEYQFKTFKKKLDLCLGMNIVFYSKYKSKEFDPVSGQFYINSDQELGNYPFADVYLKGRIQRATFFVMSTHPHEGLLGYNYFLLPNYTALDRVIRVGVSWMFLN